MLDSCTLAQFPNEFYEVWVEVQSRGSPYQRDRLDWVAKVKGSLMRRIFIGQEGLKRQKVLEGVLTKKHESLSIKIEDDDSSSS